MEPADASVNHPNETILFVFSGLPGTGKSTLAQGLAGRLKAAYVRIDTIEQALRDLFGRPIQAEGYELSYALARDQLRLGLDVVADSCNPVAATREAWAKVAAEGGARHVDIEVICPDLLEHRHRVEHRTATVPGLKRPSWEEVRNRDYEPWTRPRVVIDTSAKVAENCLAELMIKLGQTPGP